MAFSFLPVSPVGQAWLLVDVLDRSSILIEKEIPARGFVYCNISDISNDGTVNFGILHVVAFLPVCPIAQAVCLIPFHHSPDFVPVDGLTGSLRLSFPFNQRINSYLLVSVLP